MSFERNLRASQEIAKDLLVTQFDHIRGFPIRAPGYTDLWPGDPWPEALAAVGEPELALRCFETIMHSARKDGAIPHLVSGSHVRKGIETNWVDRAFYIAEGSGLRRNAAKDRWVTKLHAQPAWAIGGLAVFNHLRETGGADAANDFAANAAPRLIKATETLYNDRSDQYSDGLIASQHHNEMTNSAGKLAREGTPTYDPSINAHLINNNDAVIKLSTAGDTRVDEALRTRMQQTRTHLNNVVEAGLSAAKTPHPELVLAAARIGRADIIGDHHLDDLYAPVAEDDEHPERTHLTAAEYIEIARLTPGHKPSQDYKERIVAKIAETGQVTRFEGIAPTSNPLGNKIGRKQIWLPTAAQIVLL